jgi:mannose-6-phosphate isomerase-like protein (cupin superfamily)
MTAPTSHGDATITRRRDAVRIESGGAEIRVLLREEDGAAFSVCEFRAPPGFRGPPIPHHHTREETIFLILEGTLAITIRDTEHRVGPGELVHLPRGVDFVWCNASDTLPARFISVYCPAGFEQMFADAAETIGNRPPTPELLREVMPPLWHKYGLGQARG